MQVPSPNFSPAFYCGTAMPRIDCVALDLGAQRIASTLAHPRYKTGREMRVSARIVLAVVEI